MKRKLAASWFIFMFVAIIIIAYKEDPKIFNTIIFLICCSYFSILALKELLK